MLHGLRHLLTPGTPVYAVLKLAAIGAVIALQVAVRRRPRPKAEPEPETAPPPRKAPHPCSKKRGSRRRRSG